MDIRIGKYKHYKGNYYQVIDFAIHSETMERMVLYKPLYGEDRLWVRPAKMWNEIVTLDGIERKRFEFVSD